MVKMTRIAFVAVLAGLATGGGLLGFTSGAHATTTSDKPAAILVWPKIVVDTSGLLGGPPTDTVIQLSNTADPSTPKQAHCFYVNANSHCSDTGLVCGGTRACNSSAACIPGWTEIDFNIVLTGEQPLGWRASEGFQGDDLPKQGPGQCDFPPGQPCFADFQCGGHCTLGQTNLGTSVPGVPEDPFIGTLTCIQYDPGAAGGPAPDKSNSTNKLKGEATIISKPLPAITDTRAGVDARTYNAVGFLGTPAAGSPPIGNVLQLGRAANAPASGSDPTQEYAACPSTLIVNHLFDFATDPLRVAVPGVNGGVSGATTTVTSDLTLVPCGNDFLSQTPGIVTAQFLVFNEFEQRFSTSRTVDCFLESQLSMLDTRTPTRSIFSAFVSGTIAGQTRVRGVGSAATGRGLLGVAEMFVGNSFQGRASTAYNLHQQGDPPAGTQPDLITIP